jgi:protein phosphatase
MLEFRHARRASQGARPYQEDSAAVWPGGDGHEPVEAAPPPEGTSLVAVLADGMGGHAGGALASSTICSVVIEHFARASGPGKSRLAPALAAANDAVRARVRANPALAGMGATLVATSIGTAGLSWISVGDSPMYLFRGDELVQLNADHSLAPVIDRLVAQGRMSADQARNDPRRHFLRSAVTGEEIELVDEPERPLTLAAGDVVLIASDGIHTLEPDDIRRLISVNAAAGADAIAAALVDAVDGAGAPHQDNTTVIAVTVAEQAAG